ncbi:30S ribosomal protein S17 [Patescibacteria group bacterium]|nr:MAG: 30S ribosomal protein S17 [Patescibacteria group bacterium]
MQKTVVKREFIGKVVSANMNKTAVVVVDNMKMNVKYGKRYKVSRKYYIHDEKTAARPGDEVKFAECRPLSKTKRWRLVEILNKNQA